MIGKNGKNDPRSLLDEDIIDQLNEKSSVIRDINNSNIIQMNGKFF